MGGQSPGGAPNAQTVLADIRVLRHAAEGVVEADSSELAEALDRLRIELLAIPDYA
jgi:hypothetical protein